MSDIRLDPADERTAVLTRPFRMPEQFDVGETHTYQVYQAEKAVLIGGDNPDQTYYVECEGIAVCETCHSPQSVTDSEWQFLVNVTCHLTANRPRTNPDEVKRTVTTVFLKDWNAAIAPQ